MKRGMAAVAIAVGILAAAGAKAGQSSLAVEHAWARAMPKGAVTAAAYFTLVNKGAGDDRLLGATSPVAQSVGMHSMRDDNGVMKMNELPSLDVHPGVPVVLAPGGIHVMMTGLKQQLKDGQTFPLSLTFEKAGTVEVTVRVGKVGAMHEPDIGSGSGE